MLLPKYTKRVMRTDYMKCLVQSDGMVRADVQAGQMAVKELQDLYLLDYIDGCQLDYRREG